MKTLTKIACIIGITATSQAAVLSVTWDSGASTWDTHPSTGSPDVLFTDTFSYDPLDPTATLPNRTFGTALTMNNDNTNPLVLAFNLGSAMTLGATQTVVFDLWGRNSDHDRDDDFDILLYNGGTSGILVGSSLGNALPDTSAAYLRIGFTAGDLTSPTFDSFTIVARDADNVGTLNLFTLAEMRVATIPEPSTTALLGLAGLALILRRRK